MNLSSQLKIHKNIKFTKLMKLEIAVGHYPTQLYFVCTSKNDSAIFEIVKGKYLNKTYKNCYLVALAEDKQTAVEFTSDFIDLIYNRKIISLADLKEKRK
ncbi:MAG: hypothetical protein ATN31_00420 [Candidatus Epulonipiscioides saccharophilum]|nr:MAG: hypothetical protein ATN31_00420 [Epulopiscium sp. AS2M-Bin001]